MRLAIGLVAALLSLPPQQAPTNTATVRGITLRTGAQTPLTGVRIVLQRQGSGGSGDYATLSGSDGKFDLKNIVPGRYRLSARLQGYLPAEFGAKAPGRTGTSLELAGGQVLENLRLPLTAGSVISGRVFDQAGRPLPDVAIQLIQPRYDPDGRRIPVMALNARTNDLGEYRAYWAAAGTYYVSATAPAGADEVADRNRIINEQYADSEEIMLPTFYPNVLEERLAAPINVEAGADVRGIDFTILRQRTVHVSGQVVDRDGNPVPRLQVELRTSRDGWINLSSGFVVSSNAAGEFDFRRVPAGRYILSAHGPQAGTAAELEIQVAERAVTGVRARLEPLPSISGHLRWEGGAARNLTLTFSGIDGISPYRGVGVDTQGNFSVAMPAGLYRLSAGFGTEGYYLQSARSGTRNVLADGLDTRTGSPEPLEVVIAAANGSVAGTVTDDRGAPGAGAVVVLAPAQDRLMRSDLFRSVSTDQSGSFLLRGIAPGDYRAFAFGDLEPYRYYDPLFMQKYESLGVPLHIGNSDSLRTNLRILP